MNYVYKLISAQYMLTGDSEYLQAFTIQNMKN